MSVGGYIFYNTHVLNTFLTPSKFEIDRAQSEIKYKKYQKMAQPRIIDENVDVELFPEQRLAVFRGKEILENNTDASIDQVAVTLWPEDAAIIPRPRTDIRALAFKGGKLPCSKMRPWVFTSTSFRTRFPRTDASFSISIWPSRNSRIRKLGTERRHRSQRQFCQRRVYPFHRIPARR